MIFLKSSICRDIEEYKSRTQKLLEILEGGELNNNIYNKYANSPEDFGRDYVEIDIQELEYAISDFETSLKMLKKIKSHKAKPLHQPK